MKKVRNKKKTWVKNKTKINRYLVKGDVKGFEGVFDRF